MMPDNHHLDARWALLIEDMVRKTGEVCPAESVIGQRRGVPGIRLNFSDDGQEVLKEAIRQMKACLALVIVEDLY
jgi:hypothetical protein